MVNPEALKGHIDPLILAVLAGGPAHGYAVIEDLKQRSGGALALPEGTVYPALHRLEREGSIAASWEISENRQRVRVYRLTPAGRKRLAAERSKWDQLSEAIAGIFTPPVPEET